MRFNEIFAKNLSLRVKPKEITDKLSDTDVLDVKRTLIRGEFEIRTKEKVSVIVPVVQADINRLADFLSTGQATLSRLSDPAQDGSAELQVYLFNGACLEMGALEIGLDERAQQILDTDTLDDAAKKLWGKCVLKHGDKRYFFIVAGGAADAYLEEEKTSHANENASQKEENTDEKDSVSSEEPETTEENVKNAREKDSKRQFAIVGSDMRFKLSEKDKGFGQTIFLASGITKTRNRREDPAMRIACGDLKFVDWTAAGERSRLAKAQLDEITKSEGSYLRTWDEYGKVEGDLFLEEARNIGAIPFSIKEENKDGTVLVQCHGLSNTQKEALTFAAELDVVSEEKLPIFLLDTSMTFEEYVNGTLDANENDNFLGERTLNREKKDKNTENNVSFKVSGFNPGTGELMLEADYLPSGQYLIKSIAGEVAQIKRRMNARRAIQNQRSANPLLGLIIEENGVIPPSQPPAKVKAMSDFVKKKIFPKNPPTSAQQHAIEVALNTPDIAMIQGPPGTGKTTVIAAIIERLNQEADKRQGIGGKVLLSGFQHDAVENMIERISINGLPVPKFGQRSGDTRNADFTHYEEQLRDWSDGIVRELRAKNPQIEESIIERQIKDLVVQYIKAPSEAMVLSLLDYILKLPNATLGLELRNRIQQQIKQEKNRLNTQSVFSENISLIRCLRVSEKGFSDDGPERAGDVLLALNNELNEDEKLLLRNAFAWKNKDDKPPFLDELRSLKGKLLVRFSPVPIFQTEKVHDDIVMLVKDVIASVRQNGMSMRDEKNAALAELLMEMENNPYGLVESIKDYSYAFAATCQQSVNKTMQRMKGISNANTTGTLEYDYVIIDEAARVSPRDLMIPMSQGKRIILVGDHRQLPQLIDENVAKRMETGKDHEGEEEEWLKQSMFEYLFTKRIPHLEASDGVQRRVTLDTQFRTHSLLGDFISKNFYEAHNPDEKFGSVLPDTNFAYDLPGTNGKCAIWLDTPDGEMAHSGTSWIRSVESDVICTKLKEWISYDNKRTKDERQRLTFGVIAFYKAQTELIKRQLGDRFLDTVGETRLRIGTVDSFQGMEFDVVFLSLVRTGKTPQYGFLQLYNRLNVSMSRQKKLLVVVGNANFYNTPEAGKKVPGLKNFLQLCKEKGKII